jgi:small ligand-binding sensory domain FIST
MLTVVAQGCLPVGADMRVTQMDGALVTGLDGMDAFLRLQKAIEDLEPSVRMLLTRGPMIGVAMDPQAAALHRGDYLVRQLVGGDPARGAISIAHPLKLVMEPWSNSSEHFRLFLEALPRILAN